MDLSLIAAVSWQDVASISWWILTVAVGLGFVIFVHELGHFLVAKACGVKCEKFYIGFDIPISIGRLRLPSRFGRVQWGETEYGIGILPLGGYVKMLGQDDNPANAAREAERSRIRKARAGRGGLRNAADGGADRMGSPQLPRQARALADGHHLGRRHHEPDLCRDLRHLRL